MHLSSDQVIFWQYGWFKLNLTIVSTWVLMAVMTLGSWLATRNCGQSGQASSRRWQHWTSLMEWVVVLIQEQLKDVGLPEPARYLDLIGTLFLFVAIANLCTIIPGFEAPTGSLSTTAALALCVFVAVPYYGIRASGLARYLGDYLKPTPVMLPFNIMSELTRTLALAMRLFGNMMGDGMVIGILLVVMPFFFPVVMKLLGLLTGMVQAYIFSILATVYIAAAVGAKDDNPKDGNQEWTTQPS